MNLNKQDENIRPDSDLVLRHMEYMRRMVRIDSRSFNVNEFRGDRETPTDMKEILQLAEEYLKGIGFSCVRINQPRLAQATPILLAEIAVDKARPTVLLYAHLDKQPYMDDEKFAKWDGVPPWELRWNADRSRAYGRGAADDLSGVIAIGMAVDTLLGSLGVDRKNPSPAQLAKLPCNIKVIYETEEEAGSNSLIDQIQQNRDFFSSTNCVVITDVLNPAQGVPSLTTSLRGVIQLTVTMTAHGRQNKIDAQTALYKLLATLINGDHSLAITAIARTDKPLTEQERRGYVLVPTSVEALREMAGLLPETRLTVPADKASLLVAQLRKSYANARPGHRVSGNVVFGVAGARLTFRLRENTPAFKARLEEALSRLNPFHLKLRIKEVDDPGRTAFDVTLQSANKDPHSGFTGGPFPIPEIQLARMIDRLVGLDGSLHPASLQEFMAPQEEEPAVSVQSLFADHDGSSRRFADSSARAVVEVRLAPGNGAKQARQALAEHLRAKTPPGFALELKEDKDGADPWMTGIDQPVFSLMLEALDIGYSTASSSGSKTCLYGCGGSIPFVKKLMAALGDIHPLCIGAYDPDSRMHEPNESLSMVDLLGCARSIVYFLKHIDRAFPKIR